MDVLLAWKKAENWVCNSVAHLVLTLVVERAAQMVLNWVDKRVGYLVET